MDRNELNYRKTINLDNEYKITIKEFRIWLQDTHEENYFFKKVAFMKREQNSDKNNTENYYNLAWDYNIPIIMVKYFMK